MWRQNGSPVKSGMTDDPTMLYLNTSNPGDFVFDATDTGSVIDFIINGTTASNPVVLSNNQPTISGSGPITDAYNRTLGRPTFVWTYADADDDPQFFYRVLVGSAPLGADLYDSGKVFSTDQSHTIPNSSSAIVAGTTYYWTIQVGDGEKTNPIDPDSPEPSRVTVQSQGTAVVNTIPVISAVQVDGTSNSTITSTTPTISWSYSDIDGQPQQSYRIMVALDAGLSNLLWDSGVVLGNASSARYNFNLTGQPIPSHVTLYVGVYADDTFESSATATTTFLISSKPRIIKATVDNKVNPLNVRTINPYFNWEYRDDDNDPLTAYDIRVSTSNTDLGTDLFYGEIWHPGVIFTPESYKTQFNSDGTAFGGCAFPKQLQAGVKYYFQVQIYDLYEKSEWITGFFKLNSPPTAANVSIIPTAPFNSDDIFASYDFVDDVGDVESSKTQIKWFLNGQEVVSVRNQRMVPASMTKPGEMWYFTVRPHDGIGFSDTEFTSNTVTILNRAPQASNPIILPGTPVTTDNLQAIFSVSDPDQDDVQVTIRWYKNGTEQTQLKNSLTVPASLTTLDDEWYFTIMPSDGYDNGALTTSPTVKIVNTPPTITSIFVNGRTFPANIKNGNPTISWAYHDDDNQPQQKFHIMIGTKPARTKRFRTSIDRAIPLSSAATGESSQCGAENGILSTAPSDGTVVSGNEVFDSGIIESSISSYKYATADFVPKTIMNYISFESLDGFTISPDLQTIQLRPDINIATASGRFPGQTSFYDVEITYIKEQSRRSTYKLIVDNAVVDSFMSLGGDGPEKFKFKSIRVSHNSTVSVVGIADTFGAKAKFRQLSFAPIVQLEVNAGDIKTLSGYLQDGNGGIKLAGLAGTASERFSFPSGTYDIEIVYVTETNGNPTLSLSVNSSVVSSFSYESGAKTRSKFVPGVAINNGDTIKISGTRNMGAAARVKKLIFRPTETVKTGAKLQPGLSYFASIRVFDGLDWSRWYTTKFSMDGSAWAASVSNSRGWTIETRLRVGEG